MSVDQFAQLAVAAGTGLLALVTFFVWRSGENHRRDLARPLLNVSPTTTGITIVNAGGGPAFKVGAMQHLADGGDVWFWGACNVIVPGAAKTVGKKDDGDLPAGYDRLSKGSAVAYCCDSFGLWYRFTSADASYESEKKEDPTSRKTSQRLVANALSGNVDRPPLWVIELVEPSKPRKLPSWMQHVLTERWRIRLRDHETLRITQPELRSVRAAPTTVAASIAALLVLAGGGVDEIAGDPLGVNHVSFGSPIKYELVTPASRGEPCRPAVDPNNSDRSCELTVAYENVGGTVPHGSVAFVRLTTFTIQNEMLSCSNLIPYRAPNDHGTVQCSVEVPVGHSVSDRVEAGVFYRSPSQ